MMPLFSALSIPVMSGLSQPTMAALAVPKMSGLTQPQMKPTDMFQPHPVPWHVGVPRPLQNMAARPLVTAHLASPVTSAFVVAMFSPVKLPASAAPEPSKLAAPMFEEPAIIGSHHWPAATVGAVLDVVSR